MNMMRTVLWYFFLVFFDFKNTAVQTLPHQRFQYFFIVTYFMTCAFQLLMQCNAKDRISIYPG